jgi:hypothetical protein
MIHCNAIEYADRAKSLLRGCVKNQKLFSNEHQVLPLL